MNKLREFRKKAGLTQKEVADCLDVTESQYSRLEAGNRRLHIDDAVKLARLFGTTLNDIFLPINMTKRQVVRHGDIESKRGKAQEKNVAR